MYEAHFKLHGRPFLAAPETSRYFPGTSIEAAHRALARLIRRGEGPGLVVGPPGTGKSLLCQLLADEFSQQFVVALLDDGRFDTRAAMLRAILHRLDLPYRGLEEGELRLSLLDHLDPKHGLEEGLLLIVDEAHTLHWRLLEEVRLLTNLVRNGLPRVRVVLAGNEQLEEHFASPKLSSFSQRLAARCYLSPFDAAETAAYVRSQLAAIGGDAEALVSQDALRAIYRASDGIPRLVNQICDHALVLACLGGLNQLTSAAIDEAWADLQQLPVPWTTTVAKTPSDHIVEFAGLDEPCAEPIEAIPFVDFASQSLNIASPALEGDHRAQSSDVDGEFEPVGSIGTEVDLDFPEFGDPFAEHFEHEEVVLDRYGSDDLLFAARPRIASQAGQELGGLLESWAAARRHSVQPGLMRLDRAAATSVSEAKPANDSSEREFASAETGLRRDGSIPLGKARGADAGAAPWGAARPESRSKLIGDRDILVVDDAEPMIVQPLARSATPSAKREYKGLFSKLRRGIGTDV